MVKHVILMSRKVIQKWKSPFLVMVHMVREGDRGALHSERNKLCRLRNDLYSKKSESKDGEVTYVKREIIHLTR